MFRRMYSQLTLSIEFLFAFIAAVQFLFHVPLLVMSFHSRRAGKFHATIFMLAFHSLFCFDLVYASSMSPQMGLGYVFRVTNVTDIFLHAIVRIFVSIERIDTFEC